MTTRTICKAWLAANTTADEFFVERRCGGRAPVSPRRAEQRRRRVPVRGVDRRPEQPHRRRALRRSASPRRKGSYWSDKNLKRFDGSAPRGASSPPAWPRGRPRTRRGSAGTPSNVAPRRSPTRSGRRSPTRRRCSGTSSPDTGRAALGHVGQATRRGPSGSRSSSPTRATACASSCTALNHY